MEKERLVRSVTYRICLGGDGVERRGNGGGMTLVTIPVHTDLPYGVIIPHIFKNE